MSKRRQTIAAIGTTDKKSRTEEPVADTKNRPVSELNVDEIKAELKEYGANVSGPVNVETRNLYAKLLTKYRDGKLPPKKRVEEESKDEPKPKPRATPKKAVKGRKKDILSPNKSPEKLVTSPKRRSDRRDEADKRKKKDEEEEVDIDELPDPPATPVLTDTDIRRKLTELGQSHGAINDGNRKLYLKVIEKYEKSGNSVGTHAKKLLNKESGKSRTTSSAPLNDYPEDSEMMDVTEASYNLNTDFSYIKSPYKKTRRSLCREEFENIDFLVNLPGHNIPNQRAFFIDLKNRGVQGVITNNSSTIELVNIVKASGVDLKVYAGITITSLENGRKAITDVLQCGANAVVLSFSPTLTCCNPKSIVQTLEAVVRGHLTISYFYNHLVQACPVTISKSLIKLNNGFQGVMISTESLTLLRLEALGIKIHETNVNNMLRSLAHGVESVASYEGIIGMPLMRKLKDEYYEGNTSECCRIQLVLCRLTELLRQHGDLIPSIHTALKYLDIRPGEMPLPYTPITNEIPLIRELANMEISKWQSSVL